MASQWIYGQGNCTVHKFTVKQEILLLSAQCINLQPNVIAVKYLQMLKKFNNNKSAEFSITPLLTHDLLWFIIILSGFVTNAQDRTLLVYFGKPNFNPPPN